MSSRRRKQRCIYCDHCDEYISRSAFWKHRKSFFDVKTGIWTTKTSIQSKKIQTKTRNGYSATNQSTQSFESIFDDEASSSDDNSGLERDIKGKSRSQTCLKWDPFILFLKILVYLWVFCTKQQACSCVTIETTIVSYTTGSPTHIFFLKFSLTTNAETDTNYLIIS